MFLLDFEFILIPTLNIKRDIRYSHRIDSSAEIDVCNIKQNYFMQSEILQKTQFCS